MCYLAEQSTGVYYAKQSGTPERTTSVSIRRYVVLSQSLRQTERCEHRRLARLELQEQGPAQQTAQAVAASAHLHSIRSRALQPTATLLIATRVCHVHTGLQRQCPMRCLRHLRRIRDDFLHTLPRDLVLHHRILWPAPRRKVQCTATLQR